METLTYGQVFYLTAFLISTLAACFVLLVIRKYHQNKPLGMQTLYGKVIEVFTVVFGIVTVVMNGIYCLLELYGPFSRSLAKIFSFLELAALSSFYLTTFTLMLVKYCSIFHGTFLSNLDEERSVRQIKTCIGITSTLLAVVELTILSILDDLASFQLKTIGYSKSDSKLETIIGSLFALNAIMALILYLRTEHAAVLVNDNHSGLLSRLVLSIRNDNHHQSSVVSGYDINVLRAGLLCLLLTTPQLIYQIVGGGDIAKWNILTMATIFTVVFPLVIILKNDTMKDIAKRMLTLNASLALA